MNVFLIAYIMLSALGLGMSISDHGKERKPENAWNSLLAFVISQVLVWGIYLTSQ